MSKKMDLGAPDRLDREPAVTVHAENAWPDRRVGIHNGTSDKRSARMPGCVAGARIRNNEGSICNTAGLRQNDLLLLRRECETWDRIEKMIERRQLSYGSFSDLSVLREALGLGVKAILIDTCFLSQITQQLHSSHLQEPGTPPMLFISEQCDIRTRIEAIQAGAHRLYMEPIVLNELMAEIEALLHPEKEPDNRVLVIGQEVSRAGPIVDLLQKYGIEHQLLIDPLAIIDTVWRFRPDLILMQDIASDDVDHRVLIRLIREREESVAIPIVILTEENDPDNRLRALQAGADDVLISPVPPQQLLTVILCRIARTLAISTSGVVRSIERRDGEMWDRRRLLQRLEQLCADEEEGAGFHGVIVIALEHESLEIEKTQMKTHEPYLENLSDVLGPILQAQDVLSRLDSDHVAVLVRRGSRKELEQARGLILDMLNYRLDIEHTASKGFSVGLAMLDKGHSNGKEWLQQAENIVECATTRSSQETITRYPAASAPPDRGVREGPEWLREVFQQALKTNSIALHERKYQSLQTDLTAVRTIELIPQMDYPGMVEDIYQQAAIYAASAELDKLLCELAIERLYDYTQQGLAVRLILRQSAEVVGETEYIEHIKSVLRRLQIVGHGLVLEFSLPALATRLRDAITLFEQLAAIGITASLSHFPANEIGFKALARMNVGMIRPRSTLLYLEPEKIERIANRVRSRKVDIILPGVDDSDRISRKWFECADCIQEQFPVSLMHGDFHRPNEGLGFSPV